MVVRTFRAAWLAGAFLMAQSASALLAQSVDVPPPSMVVEPATIATTTHVYSVADLVIPVGNQVPEQKSNLKPGSTAEDKLVQTIQATVCPDSWKGGSGSIEYYPLTMSLVVNQTPEVHTHIAQLLADLRKQMDVEVAMEMRIITVSSETKDSLGLEQHEGEGVPAVAMLNDSQVHLLLEQVQGDRHTNLMQAPKLTMFNGQKATIDISDKQAYITGMDRRIVGEHKEFIPRIENLSSGLKIHALPMVSADHRYIRLQLGMELSRIDAKVPTFPIACGEGCLGKDEQGKQMLVTQYIQQPRCNVIQLEKTLVVPDGQTALLMGWKTLREVRTEPTPMLSKVPYLNRLFANVGYGLTTEHLLVLVTPRLIVHHEQEEAVPPTPAEEDCEPEVKPPTSLPAATVANEIKTKEDKPEAATNPAHAVGTLYVRDRKFQLTYDLDNVGTSQVKHIEVWWTKDAKTWERFADEVKPTGKVVIAVKDEGTYGFKLNARSGAGLSAPAPKAGDLPHTWVVVDVTPPAVKLEPVQVSNDNNGEVVVKWSVKDDNLEARPVTVRYSEKPEGPWKELVVRGAAEDTFRCSVSKLPAICFFRVDAVDKSGNVGTAWTTEPVKVDLKVPVIRNVNVKPTP